MNDIQFKKKNRPALCTDDPFLRLVPRDKVHEILNIARQRSRDIGLDDYDLGCPKRFTCDGNCSGRPVPSHVPELEPYIKKLSHLIAPDGMLYVKGCNACPIAKTCKKACAQITDYMEKNKNKEDITNKFDVSQTSTDFALGNWVSDSGEESQPGILIKLIERYGSIQDTIENMPWGSINEKRAHLVRMYCFEGKDFRACAKELGYSNGTVARNEFYRSLTTLSKFATVRFFIEEHRDEISDVDHELLQLRYYKFLTVNEIANQLNMCVGTVRSRLFRFINKSHLKYVKYVNKNKVIPSNIF
jgi:Sigma-70, region 4